MRARRRPSFIAAVALVAASAASGCGEAPARDDAARTLGDDQVTVASFDFPESELLAQLYGQALEADGYDVDLALGVGPRELVQPALARGLVEFVPEYAGTAMQFLSRGGPRPTSDQAATYAALQRQLRDRPLVALAPSPAQDANAVVVTATVAERYGLTTVSDLRPVARELIFGGPPGCRERPFCLAGLRSTYGLDFADIMALDVGGPLTHQALDGGHVDVGLLFTTDPRIEGEGLVMLADDRGLQPAENVTPLVRAEVVERWGDDLVATVDAVSAALTTESLQALNAEVAAGEPAADVAARWLDDRGLA
jgi:osmoprotectant transport system substrate-binding protein